MIGKWVSGPASLTDQSGYTPSHDGVIVSNNYGYTFTNDVPPGMSGNSIWFSNGACAMAITNTASGDPGYDNTFDSPIVTNAFTVMCWAKGWPGSYNPSGVSKWGETTYGPRRLAVARVFHH